MKQRSLSLGLAVLLLCGAMVSGSAISWGDDFYVVAAKGPRPAGLGLDPQQLAMLRWYDCSMNGRFFSITPSQNYGPIALACDGAFV